MGSTRLGQRSYALVLNDGSRKEFAAEDAAHALQMAQAVLPKGRAASLMEDGVPLAEISYSPNGFWAVSSCAPRT
jgi:hypothetical protein